MNKQKSKSNIHIVEKKDPKPSNLTLKSKDKLQYYHDEKFKLYHDTKKVKGTQKESKSNKNPNLKSKSKLQKSSHPKILQKPDHQLIFSVQRRNSASIVSQRAPSRLSNKRSSVISSKSNKFLKDQEHKENDQNRHNIDEIQNHENECIVEGLKKSIKNTKKKLSLNINPKQQGQFLNGKDANKKNQKGGKIQMFEKKMSKYLNEKDIFSEQFLQETKLCKTKSKKNLNAKSKQKTEQNLAKSKKAAEKQNLMEIYQFYKKTFDINLNNCMKYSSQASKDDKSRQTTSKTTIKPSQSSTLVFNKESNLKFVDSRMDLCERKNGSNLSNGSKSRSKSKQTLSKSKRNESKSILDKENHLFSHIQMSSLLESRSKSRNSMVNNSQTSTKDHVLSYQVEKQCANSTIEESNLRRSKKSYKNLIVFNENQIKSNQQELSIKYFDKRKSQVDDVKEMHKLSDLKAPEKFVIDEKIFIKQGQSEVMDMRKVDVGQSNIDVLKWWSNSKRQLSTSIINNQKQNGDKTQRVQKQSQLSKNQPEKDKDLRQNSNINTAADKVVTENFLLKEEYHQRDSPKMIKINDQTEKLKKKKSEQISSLGDLSSISSIHEYGDSNYGIISQNPKFLQMQDAAFDF